MTFYNVKCKPAEQWIILQHIQNVNDIFRRQIAHIEHNKRRHKNTMEWSKSTFTVHSIFVVFNPV